MTDIAQGLVGGFIFGAASSLHCACMCGAISSGTMFLLNPRNTTERIQTLIKLQAGRIVCYSAAGAIVAGFTNIAVNPAATAETYRILQWFGAAILMWIGLSMAGLVPSLALPSGLSGLPQTMGKLLRPLNRYPRVMPYALGVSWGMTPCPMVYAALFTAALSGSAEGGALWMMGFGLGTVPAIVATSLGVSTLARVKQSSLAQGAAGIAMAVFALLTTTNSWQALGAYCGVR